MACFNEKTHAQFKCMHAYMHARSLNRLVHKSMLFGIYYTNEQVLVIISCTYLHAGMNGCMASTIHKHACMYSFMHACMHVYINLQETLLYQ